MFCDHLLQGTIDRQDHGFNLGDMLALDVPQHASEINQSGRTTCITRALGALQTCKGVDFNRVRI